VLVLNDKNITIQETLFIEILHTVSKWVLLDRVTYCACYSFSFRAQISGQCIFCIDVRCCWPSVSNLKAWSV